MLIYGSRMYFKSNAVKSMGECEHCGVYGKLHSYQASKFGHLYFIPIIPMGGKAQVLRECTSCKMGAHVPTKDLDPMVDALSDQFKSWIVAIQDGKTELTPEGASQPINIGVLVAGILDDLYCLKEIEGIDSISSIFESSNLSYEKEVVSGRWNEIQGDLQAAKLNFLAAHRIRPEETAPLYQLGSTEVKLGNVQEAEDAFKKYSVLQPDDLSPYIELAGLYEGNKDFPKIVETYDTIYSLNSEAIPNKAMRKVYKKACKKSGVQGKFLSQM